MLAASFSCSRCSCYCLLLRFCCHSSHKLALRSGTGPDLPASGTCHALESTVRYLRIIRKSARQKHKGKQTPHT
jgi:hypothetical protein